MPNVNDECFTHGSDLLFCADCVHEYVSRMLERLAKKFHNAATSRGDGTVDMQYILSVLNEERNQ